jgi:hypothetical protein
LTKKKVRSKDQKRPRSRLKRVTTQGKERNFDEKALMEAAEEMGRGNEKEKQDSDSDNDDSDEFDDDDNEIVNGDRKEVDNDDENDYEQDGEEIRGKGKRESYKAKKKLIMKILDDEVADVFLEKGPPTMEELD